MADEPEHVLKRHAAMAAHIERLKKDPVAFAKLMGASIQPWQEQIIHRLAVTKKVIMKVEPGMGKTGGTNHGKK